MNDVFMLLMFIIGFAAIFCAAFCIMVITRSIIDIFKGSTP